MFFSLGDDKLRTATGIVLSLLFVTKNVSIRRDPLPPFSISLSCFHISIPLFLSPSIFSRLQSSATESLWICPWGTAQPWVLLIQMASTPPGNPKKWLTHLTGIKIKQFVESVFFLKTCQSFILHFHLSLTGLQKGSRVDYWVGDLAPGTSSKTILSKQVLLQDHPFILTRYKKCQSRLWIFQLNSSLEMTSKTKLMVNRIFSKTFCPFPHLSNSI